MDGGQEQDMRGYDGVKDKIRHEEGMEGDWRGKKGGSLRMEQAGTNGMESGAWCCFDV